MTSDSHQEQDTSTVHLEISCLMMTARKQYFPMICVLHRCRDYCLGCFFPSYFLLFITFGPTSSASQYARCCCCIYGISGHSHPSDMAIHEHITRDSTCSMSIGRDVTSIVTALYSVDVPRGVCVLRTPLVCDERRFA